MLNRKLRSFAWKFAVLVVIGLTPSAWGQNALTEVPSSAALSALPAALKPSAIPAPSSAPAINPATSSIHVPAITNSKPIRTIGVESAPSRREWLMLSLAAHGAAALDAYSTRRSIESGNVEADPVMKPFANSGAIYVATQVSPLLMDYAAYKMQHSSNRLIRRLWWIPQSAAFATSLNAGIHNLRI